MRNYAIVCPGPSLSKFSLFEHDPGCLISVNSAVIHRYGASVPDYWTLMDPELFLTVSKRVDLKWIIKRTVLWVPENFEHQALGVIDTGWGQWTKRERDIFGLFDIVTFRRDFSTSMPFGKHIPWDVRSMFMAMALAIINGATTIRLYGCDLEGLDYWHHGFKNSRTNMTDKRWENERMWLEHIVHSCVMNGVQVIRENR